MTNLDSILKSRDITLPTKVRLVKAMVFFLVVKDCKMQSLGNIDCNRRPEQDCRVGKQRGEAGTLRNINHKRQRRKTQNLRSFRLERRKRGAKRAVWVRSPRLRNEKPYRKQSAVICDREGLAVGRSSVTSTTQLLVQKQKSVPGV